MGSTTKYNTLFLDRDGVLNVHRPNDYVKTIDEFVFLPGVKEALRVLSSCFHHIVVVTNQRGVGRGIMSKADLANIHARMLQEITQSGGRIDHIYVCTATNDSDPDRKPNIGMALQAKRDFPDINFSDSFMAGDSLSDMEFALNAGLRPILLGNKYDDDEIRGYSIYAKYPDLFIFAQQINSESGV